MPKSIAAGTSSGMVSLVEGETTPKCARCGHEPGEWSPVCPDCGLSSRRARRLVRRRSQVFTLIVCAAGAAGQAAVTAMVTGATRPMALLAPLGFIAAPAFAPLAAYLLSGTWRELPARRHRLLVLSALAAAIASANAALLAAPPDLGDGAPVMVRYGALLGANALVVFLLWAFARRGLD